MANNQIDDLSSSQKPFPIEGKKSSNKSIEDFVKETQRNSIKYERSLKWIDFETFKDIKQIGEGGFARVYSATWLNGGKKLVYSLDGAKKIRTLPDTVALKSIKGSNEISDEFLNEMETYYKLTLKGRSLPFYGLTKDPNSSEFMMVTGLAQNGSLRSLLTKNFTNLNWKEKIRILSYIIIDIKSLHEQGICHKDFHSGNILRGIERYFITDFGLAGPSNKSSKEIYGILGYVAPEVLKGKQYNAPADIYSFGILMTELSSGFPPYSNKDLNEATLALAILNGLRPDFGKGTPEIYKSLAYRCMDANPEKRPIASELEIITSNWYHCLAEENNDDDANKIKMVFEIADKEIPNVQSLFKKKSNFKYISKHLNFNNLPIKSLKSSVYQGSDILGLALSDEDIEDLE